MNFKHHDYVILQPFGRLFAIFYIISRNSILFKDEFSTPLLGGKIENVDIFLFLSTLINTSVTLKRKSVISQFSL